MRNEPSMFANVPLSRERGKTCTLSRRLHPSSREKKRSSGLNAGEKIPNGGFSFFGKERRKKKQKQRKYESLFQKKTA